jgi:AraC family transcriptional regulator, positive regulator of tynA and feaB
VFGFTTLDLASNTRTIRRSYRDVRLDGVDSDYAVFPVAGQLIMEHNDRAISLAAGDVLLLDVTRPMAGRVGNEGSSWNALSINLPRQALVSHLGFDPQGGLYRRHGTPAGRMLLELIRHSGQDEPSEFSARDSYMQLVIYDLVGALFAPERGPASRHTDKLFARISGVIRDNFADPDFGPAEVAARAGISLCYLHKLFTERGSTCRKFIYSCRLDHAAAVLSRLRPIASGQHLCVVTKHDQSTGILRDAGSVD